MKKLMPENDLYWIKKGYSKEDANHKASSYSRYKGNPKYYLCRDITNDKHIAETLANNWKQEKCPLNRENMIKNKFNGDETEYMRWKVENCALSKDNMTKTMSEADYNEYKRKLGKNLKGSRLTDVEYWTKQGYTETDAISKIRDNNIKISPRRIEYWIGKGYSLGESIQKISEFQCNNTIDNFIQRYGKERGENEYEIWRYGQRIKSIRSYLYWIDMGYTLEDAIRTVSKIQSDYGKIQPKCSLYWIKKGYTKNEATVKSKEFASRMCMWCKEYWIDKGYDDASAIEKISAVQKQNSMKGLLSYKHSANLIYSKLELKIREYFIKNNIEFETDYMVNDIELKKIYFPDLVFDSFIIEIYGDFWHANPSVYSPNDKIIGETTAHYKWKYDANRIHRLKKITNKPVFIWWESDIHHYGIDFLYNKLKKEIKNENN